MVFDLFDWDVGDDRLGDCAHVVWVDLYFVVEVVVDVVVVDLDYVFG